MFERLQDGLQSAVKSLRGKGRLSEGNMRDGLKLVEQSLLEADAWADVWATGIPDELQSCTVFISIYYDKTLQNFLFCTLASH